jgi:hypothetical protein
MNETKQIRSLIHDHEHAPARSAIASIVTVHGSEHARATAGGWCGSSSDVRSSPDAGCSAVASSCERTMSDRPGLIDSVTSKLPVPKALRVSDHTCGLLVTNSGPPVGSAKSCNSGRGVRIWILTFVGGQKKKFKKIGIRSEKSTHPLRSPPKTRIFVLYACHVCMCAYAHIPHRLLSMI